MTPGKLHSKFALEVLKLMVKVSGRLDMESADLASRMADEMMKHHSARFSPDGRRRMEAAQRAKALGAADYWRPIERET